MDKGIAAISKRDANESVTDEESRKPVWINECHGVTDQSVQDRYGAPILGGDGFLDVLNRALKNGQITQRERDNCQKLHFNIRRALGRYPGDDYLGLPAAPEGPCEDKCGRAGKRVWVGQRQVCYPCGRSRTAAAAKAAA